MAYDSLGAFIQRLDRAGELRRIKTTVSPLWRSPRSRTG